jgi:hypothetical protein
MLLEEKSQNNCVGEASLDAKCGDVFLSICQVRLVHVMSCGFFCRSSLKLLYSTRTVLYVVATWPFSSLQIDADLHEHCGYAQTIAALLARRAMPEIRCIFQEAQECYIRWQAWCTAKSC